jgi:hypothetical protein
MSDFGDVSAKLDFDRLVQPAVDGAIDSIVAVTQEQGGGLGAQRNSVSAARGQLGASVTSSLIWPRTVGRAWGANNEQRFAAAAPGIEARAAGEIEGRFGA